MISDSELKWRLCTTGTYRNGLRKIFFNNTEVRPQDENISFESKYERGDHYDTRIYLLPAYVADLIRLYK